jgi:signal peptidase I
MGRLLLALVSIALPGLGPALWGRWIALGFGLAAALTVLGAGVGAALSRCPCPLWVGGAIFVGLGVWSAWLGWRTRPRGRGPVRVLLAVAVVALPGLAGHLVRETALDFYLVPTDSMSPTIRPGEFVLVSRLEGPTARGDLVVFRGEDGRLYLKRVAGLPGERISVQQGELWVDGHRAPLLLDRDPGAPLAARYYTETGARRHRVLFREPWVLRSTFPERLIPRGHFFVLGDNRDRSEDSRRYGVVPLSSVVGRPFSLGPRVSPEGDLLWGRLGVLL